MKLSDLNNCHTVQLSFLMIFPKAFVEKYLYMDTLKVFDTSKGSIKDYVLKIHRNIYG